MKIVFGLASLSNRIGVFSFARYDENFLNKKKKNIIDKEKILYRSCMVGYFIFPIMKCKKR